MFTAAVWGFSWLCGRVISSAGIPAVEGSLARFAFGSAGLLALMLARRSWPSLSWPVSTRLAAMGFFGVFLYNICFFTGLKTVPAGRASLMAALQPSMVFLFSAIVWRERTTPTKLVGLSLSFCGALLVLSQGDLRQLFESGLNSGDLWILGTVVSWVAYTLLGRGLTDRFPAVAGTAYSTWMGTAMLLLYGFGATNISASWNLTTGMAAVFLGLVGTSLAFLLFLQGVQHIGASRAAIFINLVPVFGVVFSSLVLGERPTLMTLLGGAIVIAGVRLLNRSSPVRK
jgi:drug/metabolite transporter (DMT)-like permease